MLTRRLIIGLVFLFAVVAATKAQNIDSLKQLPQTIATDTTLATGPSHDYKEDDPPFLVFLTLFAFGFFILSLICVGIGLIVAAIVLLVFFAFVSIGIVSLSVIASLYKRSFSSGLRMFLILSGVAAGAGLGIVGAFLFSSFSNYHLSQFFLFSVGIVSGIAAGIILGQLMFIMFRKVVAYFNLKVN